MLLLPEILGGHLLAHPGRITGRRGPLNTFAKGAMSSHTPHRKEFARTVQVGSNLGFGSVTNRYEFLLVVQELLAGLSGELGVVSCTKRM